MSAPFKFNARALVAVAAATADPDSRPMTKCVRLECAPKGAWAVASNGHLLIAAYDPDAEVSANAVHLDFTADHDLRNVVLGRRATSENRRTMLDTITRDGLFNNEGKCVRKFAITDADDVGEYPEWRKVVPQKFRPFNVMPFNNEYLARLLHSVTMPYVIQGHPAMRQPGVAIYGSGDDTTCYVIVPGRATREVSNVRMAGLLMPMRQTAMQTADNTPPEVGALGWITSP